MEIRILYEDNQLIVCEKEAGIPVQSARILTKDMVSILKNYRSTQEKTNGEPYIGLIQRLDQPVQGVIVFAKTKEAAAKLSEQLRNGNMKKLYRAVTWGKPPEKESRLVDYILKDGKTNLSKIVKKETKGAKKAELDYRILAETEQESLVEIELLTGRHHQIRVQMAGAGCPICGDRKYNDNASDTWRQMALCAFSLSFQHPKSNKKMIFSCDPKGGAFDKFR